MKNIWIFLSEIFHFLVVEFSVYLNRHVFVMIFLHTITFTTYHIRTCVCVYGGWGGEAGCTGGNRGMPTLHSSNYM